jgi:putative OPT family oligopeptide transporter
VSDNNAEPLIGPEQSLPEITVKAVILAVILTIVLCSSNAYLGLKVGTTISASIPAAVIAMGVLRMFKTSNVLEVNIVQTAASVGEALVAGMAFVMPALLITGYWNYFHFWGTFVVSLLGGSLGMLFSIPVRRVMLSDKTLHFPEGTAIGSVLKASADSSTEMRPLLMGGLIGSLVSLFQTGFKIVADHMEIWFSKGTAIFGFSLGFSPAMLAAGYIIGINVAISIITGIVLGWVIGMPVLSHIYAPHAVNAIDSARDIWTNYIRYIGVGTMLVGGIWTMVTLLKPIFIGLRTSFQSISLKGEHGKKVIRTERDIPIHLTAMLVLLVLIIVFFLFYNALNPATLGVGEMFHVIMCLVGTLFVLVGGFIFACISAYFAGLIGSTNNPASGMIISSLLLFSFIVIMIFSIFSHLTHARALELGAFVVMVSALVGCILCIANDTMQDLKAGYMVGATPWKQQVMLIVGVVVASFVIAPVLQLLFHAYGIGGVFPRPGMPESEMLAAPQATSMAALIQGVFNHNLPWAMLITGAVIAVFAIIADEVLKRQGKRLPVLAIGLGIYLPLSSSTPLAIGGVVSFLANHYWRKRIDHLHFHKDKKVHKQLQRALMLACGIVAGASVMGVVLAIPFAIERSANALQLVGANFQPFADALGIIITLALARWIYRTVVKDKGD